MGLLKFLLGPKVLNPLLSIFDREAREAIRRIAATVSDDSFLRSESFGRAFDVLRGIIEGLDLGALSPVAEKLTDYGDALAENLTGKHKEAKAEDVLQGWMNKFFADAGERLKKAADPESEGEKIEKEFTARMKLLNIIEAAAKKIAEEKKAAEKKPPTGAESPKVGEAVGRFLNEWKTRAKRHGYTERKKS